MPKLRQALAAALLAAGMAAAAGDATRIDSSPAVHDAIDEILARLPDGVTCTDSEAWQVTGNLEDAARWLVTELDTRGWAVIEHGQLEKSYAMLIDPDPSDDRAVALGGLMNDTDAASVVFLDRCELPEQEQTAPN